MPFPPRVAGFAVISALLFCACNKPHLHNFAPDGFQIQRAFGQLYDDSGTKKVSHYAIVQLPTLSTSHLFAISSGTIEYAANVDGMGNCLFLRTSKHLTTPNDFSTLRALPAPGALVLVYGHLDEAAVRSDIRAIYQAKNANAPGSELDAAVNHFIAGDEGFKTLDVTAHESDPLQSTPLGQAVGNDLYLTSFIEESGVRTYVNPLPYLSAVVSSTTTDSVAPTIDEVVVETSASGTFGADRATHAIGAGDTIALPLPREFLRVAVRSTELYQPATPVTVPYRILTTLTRTNAPAEVKARGEALLNSLRFTDAAVIATAAYGSNGAVTSDIATDHYYRFAGWHPDAPPPAAADAAFNALATPGTFTLDLNRMASSTQAFPPGNYDLEIKVEDLAHTAGAPATKTIHFTLDSGALVEVLRDTNNDHVIGAGDTVLDAVEIARWDNAYGAAPGYAVANAADPANFIDQDPSRFYVRVTDPGANTDATTVQQVTAKIGTLDIGLAVRDDLTDMTLTETGPNTGVFVSRSQLLTTVRMTPAVDEDDDFQAHSGPATGAPVADDAPGDRTHQAAIDDFAVRIIYPAAGGPGSQTLNTMIFERAPEFRREVKLRVVVFNEPFDDDGYDNDANPGTPVAGAGNGVFDFTDTNHNGRHDAGEACERFLDLSTGAGLFGVAGSRGGVVDQAHVDAQIARANIAWAPAAIKFVSLGTTFADAPLNPITHDNILRDGTFSFGPGFDDSVVIAAYAPAATIDVVEVFFTAPIVGYYAFTRTPSDFIVALGEKTFVFLWPNLALNRRTLAHEFGHCLDNSDYDNDASQIDQTIFYPAGPPTPDDAINSYRRFTKATMDRCRTKRAAGDLAGIGNRFLKIP